MRTALMPGLLVLSLLLAACGSSAQGSSTNRVAPALGATRTYNDPAYHFSFKYPATWKAPKKGKTEVTESATLYAVQLTIPSHRVGVEVTVVETPYSFPSFTNGHVGKDPSGPDTFQYFHTKVMGLSAVRVYRRSKGQAKEVDGIDTFVSHAHLGIAIRMVTGLPPFRSLERAQYNEIVKTFKVPFS